MIESEENVGKIIDSCAYRFVFARQRNGIVDEIAKDERIAELYSLWYDRKEETVRIYSDAVPKRIPLSSNDEFKTIRNAVIKEAMRISTEQTERELSPDPPEEEPHEREWERRFGSNCIFACIGRPRFFTGAICFGKTAVPRRRSSERCSASASLLRVRGGEKRRRGVSDGKDISDRR